MEANVNGRSGTALIGVLGYPVRHSLSPRMHNAALRAQGLDMVYVAFEVLPADLGAALAGLRALGSPGVNLTIPHKESALHLLDGLDQSARVVGSVNTVLNDAGRLVGYNTDKSGFASALRGLRTEGATGLVCFVAGAGGAARAVVAALVEDEAREIRIWNRTATRAESLCLAARSWGETRCDPIATADIREAARSADLIVNATSVGLVAPVKESAIPVDILLSRHLVMDLVYGTGPTLLVKEACARGARAIDGKGMLVMQAAGSYELWTGLRPPVDIMRDSIHGWER